MTDVGPDDTANLPILEGLSKKKQEMKKRRSERIVSNCGEKSKRDKNAEAD